MLNYLNSIDSHIKFTVQQLNVGGVIPFLDTLPNPGKFPSLAILKHCTDFHHPLLSTTNLNIIDKDPSQITQEVKEAIYIQRLDPKLNRNVGKISIPHCFDHLISAKPKHPRVGLLSQVQNSVDKVAPPSQIPDLCLTQFNNIGTFRPN